MMPTPRAPHPRQAMQSGHAVLRWSANFQSHNELLLFTMSCTRETVVQAPTVCLLPDNAHGSGCFDGDLKLLTRKFEQLTLNGFSHSELELVLVVRHIFQEKVNSLMAVHDWMQDPRNHFCGQLHGPVPAPIHWVYDRLQNICDMSQLVPLFNSQQKGIWSISYRKDTHKASTPILPWEDSLCPA